MKTTKKLFLSIIIFLIISLWLSCEREKTVYMELDLLSYNVAGLPEGLSSSQPALYTSLISPLLNNFSIVHVQEDFCYHDSLLLYNTHLYQTEPMPCVPNGDGLNTFSSFPILNFERIAWNDCGGADCLTPKGFSYSKIQIGDSQIDFYNVHCNAGSNELNAAARRGNIKQLTDYIKMHSENEAVIVMGDFNSRYTREVDTIRTMFELGFSDAWIELVRNGDVPHFGDSLKDCEPLGTSEFCEGIDKFFYRSNDKITFRPLIYKHGDDKRFTYNNIDTLPLSDHVPTYVKMEYFFKVEE